jgi:hypothetical protein
MATMPQLPPLSQKHLPPILSKDEIDSFLEEKKQLLFGIGLCITEWSTIDFQLLRLTCDGLGTGSRRSAIVYLSTGMISKRIELVSELIECVLLEVQRYNEDDNSENNIKDDRQALTKEWDFITKELRDMVPFRNKLAHWTMSASRPDRTKNFRPALGIGIPEIFREKRNISTSNHIYYDDIVEHYARLQALGGKISAFGPSFAKEAKQLPKPSRKLSWLWKPSS